MKCVNELNLANNEKQYKCGCYLIHLLACVLNGCVPHEKPEDIDFEEIYHLAKAHSVESMAISAMKELQSKPRQDLLDKWNRISDRNITQSITQLGERDIIIQKLTEQGIDILPLKGCILKELYPRLDYRQMADIDILIDGSKAKDAKAVMEALGYTSEHFNVSNHDVYEKAPYMGVELHRNLLSENNKNYDYYKNIWKKALPDKKIPHCYYLHPEDCFIYLIVHFEKHYNGCGSGIRSIMDIALFLRLYGEKLDQAYLRQEFTKLQLLEFAEASEKLAKLWFSDGMEEYTEDLREMERQLISLGVYGNVKNLVNNQIKHLETEYGNRKKAKIIYVLKRIFLPKKEIRCLYPFLNKVPFLLPFCWVHRLVHAVISKPEVVKNEIRYIKENNES